MSKIAVLLIEHELIPVRVEIDYVTVATER
jgi:hypothetical protein